MQHTDPFGWGWPMAGYRPALLVCRPSGLPVGYSGGITCPAGKRSCAHYIEGFSSFALRAVESAMGRLKPGGALRRDAPPHLSELHKNRMAPASDTGAKTDQLPAFGDGAKRKAGIDRGQQNASLQRRSVRYATLRRNNLGVWHDCKTRPERKHGRAQSGGFLRLRSVRGERQGQDSGLSAVRLGRRAELLQGGPAAFMVRVYCQRLAFVLDRPRSTSRSRAAEIARQTPALRWSPVVLRP